jgi:PAS domain S-box-containing protein
MDWSTVPWQEILTGLAMLIAGLLSIGNRKLKSILGETQTNGGSSIKDQLNRIETNVEDLTLWVEASQHLTAKSMFKTDSTGRFVWVNVAFARLIGVGLEELKGMGWINYLSPIEHDRVSEEWKESIEDQRKFESVFKVLNAYSDEQKEVKARAYPIIKEGKVLGYLGTWIVLEENPAND